MSAEDAKKSVLDDDRVFHFDIQKASVESLQFLNIFGVTIKDFVGKTEKEIKTIIRPTYYRLVKECHPDLHPGNEKKEAEFKKLSEAYETLIDPDKRAMYFQTGGKK
ncbi:MAG: DnaJ domain-containing protein [Candidatus Kerfeldbacteria bacterium]|nr:DnaJ domain-containing protein [Candidatus Kerfeldbacteria bacterium]